MKYFRADKVTIKALRDQSRIDSSHAWHQMSANEWMGKSL